VKVTRTLVYEGNPKWIQNTLRRSFTQYGSPEHGWSITETSLESDDPYNNLDLQGRPDVGWHNDICPNCLAKKNGHL